MMKRTVIGAVVLSFLVGSQAMAMVVVSTEFGQGADTWIINDPCNGGANANWGTRTTMSYRWLVDSRFRTAYFRLDLSGAAGNLTGAILQLDLTFNNGSRARTLNVYGLVDGAADFWDEATITYNNAPGFLPTNPINNGNWIFDTDPARSLTLLGQIAVPAAAGVMSSTTAALNLDSFLAANTNSLVTFVIMPGTSDTNVMYDWATKEHATAMAPTLVLPHAIPEPATMAILGLGSLVLLRRRRA
ncbi:MAG TPA: DNRLRE domain-containing protein [Sedimentisphaerales bacterium]|nr:DNRLRE domain-containing protein [Sedimentisphaerales bacterium]